MFLCAGFLSAGRGLCVGSLQDGFVYRERTEDVLNINLSELLESDWGQGVILLPEKRSCQFDVPVTFRGDGKWDADRCWANIEAGAVREMGLRLDFARAARMKPNFYALVRDYMAQEYVAEMGTNVLDHFEVSVSYGAGAGAAGKVELILTETGSKLSFRCGRDQKGNIDCNCVLDAIERHLQKMFYLNGGKSLLSAEQREAICAGVRASAPPIYHYKEYTEFWISEMDDLKKQGVGPHSSFSVKGSFTIRNNRLTITASGDTAAKNLGGIPRFNMTVYLMKKNKLVASKGMNKRVPVLSVKDGRYDMGVAYFDFEPPDPENKYSLRIDTGYQFESTSGNPWSSVATKMIPIEITETNVI